MTLVKRSKHYHYDFWFKGKRYQGTTDQVSREHAERVEALVKERLRLDQWGIGTTEREQTPSFTKWAEQTLVEKRKTLTRPEIFERTLRMVLGFFGRRPTVTTPVEDGPYHDLYLLDPILEPEWIVKFDAWMDARELAASTKNSYRSAASGLYELALKPRWRKFTRIKENPFEHIDRDRPNKRRTRLSLDQLRSWLQYADPHARLALAIGALAPKLRLHQVLALRFDRHFDPALTRISFDAYKTVRHHDGEPQETAIVPELRAILLAIKRVRRKARYVVTYRGEPVDSIKRALKSAAADAGLAYGMQPGAVTFHTLRHAMATEIARLGGISRILHASTMGHSDARTTEQFYTHLEVEDQRPVLEQLALKTNLAQFLIDDGGNLVGTAFRHRGKDRAKRGPRASMVRTDKPQRR